MGTVVFPDAALKVFVTASPEERARRRHKQLIEKGISVSIEGLLRDILERDARDAGRAVAPLKPAADAVILDTTQMTIDAAVAFVLERYRAAIPPGAKRDVAMIGTRVRLPGIGGGPVHGPVAGCSSRRSLRIPPTSPLRETKGSRPPAALLTDKDPTHHG